MLGGDCTVSLGVVSGLAHHRDVGLLYFDGDADLGVPETTDSAIADTMGMTHFLGGGRDEPRRVGPRYPLVAAGQVVLFGFDPHEPDTAQWTSLNAHRLTAYTAPEVRSDPIVAATAARRQLEERSECFLVHLDVDVLDTGAFPLANFPHFNGLALGEMSACAGGPVRQPAARWAGGHRGQPRPRSRRRAAATARRGRRLGSRVTAPRAEFLAGQGHPAQDEA